MTRRMARRMTRRRTLTVRPAVGTLVTLPEHYHWSRGRSYRVVAYLDPEPAMQVIFIGDKRKTPKRYTVFPEECTRA